MQKENLENYKQRSYCISNVFIHSPLSLPLDGSVTSGLYDDTLNQIYSLKNLFQCADNAVHLLYLATC